MQNMGLTSGHVNAIEYCVSMHKAEELPDLLEMFKRDLQAGKVEGVNTGLYVE
jgi:hypothetical protein